MSASAPTESTTTSPAEDVTLADAPAEQLGSEPLATQQYGPQQYGAPHTATQQYGTETAQHQVIEPTKVVPVATADRESSTQTLSIIAFALSVAAVVAPSFVLLPIASLVLGIIALARKPRAKGFALTAVIISGTMLALALLVAVGAVFLFGLAAVGSYAG